jgi:hypothetical protein
MMRLFTLFLEAWCLISSSSRPRLGTKMVFCAQNGNEVMLAYHDVPVSHGLPFLAADTSADELFRLGLQYSTGQGGKPIDYVSAHMMFNLAAMRGSLEAKIYRHELSREMDQSEVAEAQKAAREWLSNN